MSRSSRHSASHYEKYALSETTSSVSRRSTIALSVTQLLVVPPHGQDDLQNLQSIFEIEHLRESCTFLDTQCAYIGSQHIARGLLIQLSLDRMPPQIGEFISQYIYDGRLLSDARHVVPSSDIACRFIDVNGIERLDKDGKSSHVSVAFTSRCRRQPRLNADAHKPSRTKKRSTQLYFSQNIFKTKTFPIV